MNLHGVLEKIYLTMNIDLFKTFLQDVPKQSVFPFIMTFHPETS